MAALKVISTVLGMLAWVMLTLFLFLYPLTADKVSWLTVSSFIAGVFLGTLMNVYFPKILLADYMHKLGSE